MRRNISDLLDGYFDESLEESGEVPYSPSRIKELTMNMAENKSFKHTGKHRLRGGLLLAAALLALTGAAVAAVLRAGVLDQFSGDVSLVEPYVQTNASAETEDYRLTLDSALYDGRQIYAIVTVEGLNEQATQDLMSNRVIAETHREFWGDDMAEQLLESGREGPDTFHISLPELPKDSSSSAPIAGGMSSSELPHPSDSSRSWELNFSLPRYVGAVDETAGIWLDFLGREHGVSVSLNTLAETIRLTPNEEVVCNTYTGQTAVLRELVLSPTSFSVSLEEREAEDDTPMFSYFLRNQLMLRMKDGSVVTSAQLGATNQVFETVVDVSQVQSIIYGYTEFPVDGSPSFPAELDPRLYPSAVDLLEQDGTGLWYLPLEEVCQNLGAGFSWDSASKTARASYRGVTLTFTEGSASALKNGEPLELSFPTTDEAGQEATVPLPVLREDGRLFVPASALTDSWSMDGFGFDLNRGKDDTGLYLKYMLTP